MSGLFTSVFSASLVLVFVLTGCSMPDVNTPHVWGPNEVPQNVVDEPRVVPVPGPIDRASWLRMGDMPMKPRDFTPQPVIDDAKAQMESDREDAESLRQQYDEQPPVISTMSAH